MLASFLQQWLLLRLPGFNERHPQIDMRIHTSDQLVDFRQSDVQAAIRFGAGPWPNLHSEKFLDEWVLPVCTRALLDKHGPVSRRSDLRRYRLLHEDSEAWRVWPGGATDEGTFMAEEHRGATFDDSVASCVPPAPGRAWRSCAGAWLLRISNPAGWRLRAARSFPSDSPTILCAQQVIYAWRRSRRFAAWIVEEARRAPRPPLKS